MGRAVHHSKPSIRSESGQNRVGKKIGILEEEGAPPKQAIAMALSMERERRLTKEGGYKRVKK